MNNFILSLIIITTLISCKLNEEKKELQEPNGQRPSVSQMFSEMDSNEDGKLSENEIKGPIAEQFKI